MTRLTRRQCGCESGHHRTPTRVHTIARLILILAIIVTAAAAQQDTPPGFTAWFCPMHPEVTATEAGRCRKCGMALVAGDPFDTREYGVELSTTPVAIKAGVRTTLTFTMRHPGTGDLVTRTSRPCTRSAITCSSSAATWRCSSTSIQSSSAMAGGRSRSRCRSPADYQLLSDFLPTGGSPQFIGRTIETAGFDGDLESQTPHLQPDTVLTKDRRLDHAPMSNSSRRSSWQVSTGT